MPFKQVFETALTDVWSATEGAKIGDKPGDIRWERDASGMKCYKCIIYNNGAGNVDAIAGLCGYYYGVSGDPAATGYIVHTVTMDYDDQYGVGAGIFQAAMTDGQRGWVQIKGPATCNSAIFNADCTDGGAVTSVGAGVDGELDLPAADGSFIVGAVEDETAYTLTCDFPF
jgi:hypothetical protein